jgi:colicin import membrane protein
MSQSSSVLFSLQELARMEEERVRLQARAEAAAREAARRAADEAEARAKEAAEAEERVREEARREIARRAREEAARVQAIRDAAAEAARTETIARVHAEERERDRQHAIEVARVQASARGSRRTATFAASVATVVTAGVAMVAYFGIAAPAARAALADARGVNASRDRTIEQLRAAVSAGDASERALQLNLAGLRDENSRLRADIKGLKSRIPAVQPTGHGAAPAPKRAERALDGFTTCAPGVDDPMCAR